MKLALHIKIGSQAKFEKLGLKVFGAKQSTLINHTRKGIGRFLRAKKEFGVMADPKNSYSNLLIDYTLLIDNINKLKLSKK